MKVIYVTKYQSYRKHGQKRVFAQLYRQRSKIQIDTYHTAFMLTYRQCFPCCNFGTFLANLSGNFTPCNGVSIHFRIVVVTDGCVQTFSTIVTNGGPITLDLQRKADRSRLMAGVLLLSSPTLHPPPPSVAGEEGGSFLPLCLLGIIILLWAPPKESVGTLTR
jgi:hypothetical protein